MRVMAIVTPLAGACASLHRAILGFAPREFLRRWRWCVWPRWLAIFALRLSLGRTLRHEVPGVFVFTLTGAIRAFALLETDAQAHVLALLEVGRSHGI